MPVKECCFPSHPLYACLCSSSHSYPCQDDSLAFTVWPFLLSLVFMAGHRGCSKVREINPNAAASLAGCDGTGEHSQERCRRGPGSRASMVNEKERHHLSSLLDDEGSSKHLGTCRGLELRRHHAYHGIVHIQT